MKFMTLLGFIALLFGAGCKPQATPALSAPSDGSEAMRGLRTMMLTTRAAELGIQPNQTFPKVFGIVMDMSVAGGHTATVVSMCDGNGSLYTTSTFGVLGGIGHEAVRLASTNFVTEAQSHFDAASSTTNFPYPASEHVRFYLLGFDGVRVIDAEMAAVEKGTDTRLALWIAGQRVLTELRLTTEKSIQKP